MNPQLAAGLVIRIADRHVRPSGKLKWHICACPQQRWFLRINSRPLWPPHVLIAKGDYGWLAHDSYVELRQVCRFLRSEVDAALADPKGVLGRISRVTAALLVQEVRLAATLTEDEKDVIAGNLSRC